MKFLKSFLQHCQKFRQGFSLIEVNMAIFVLAGGALALLSLFPFGLQQSRNATNEMILSACADRYLGAAALIATQPGMDFDKFVDELSDISKFNVNVIEGDMDNIDTTNFEEFPNSNKGLYYYAWAYTEDVDTDNTSDNEDMINVHVGVMVSTENCKVSKAARRRAQLFATKVFLTTKNDARAL